MDICYHDLYCDLNALKAFLLGLISIEISLGWDSGSEQLAGGHGKGLTVKIGWAQVKYL